MAQPYVGEIRIFAGNFAPSGWMFCEGQLLPISEFETLFNLIGTTYGGDGQSTVALPDMRGRIPIHMGNGFTLADSGGVEAGQLAFWEGRLRKRFALAQNLPSQWTASAWAASAAVSHTAIFSPICALLSSF